jgi:hypothetical protein
LLCHLDFISRLYSVLLATARYVVLILTATSILTTVASSQYGDPLTVLIAIQEETNVHVFELPREKVSSVSRFFEKAFQGNFLEAATGTMSMIDISAKLFSIFAHWVTTDRLGAYSLKQLLELYVLADRIDVPALRASIIDQLVTTCFKPKFDVPENDLLTFMMVNVPKSLPIHNLLAIAVAKVLYHKPEGLDDLPYWFGVRVQKRIDKPYGLCDQCYAQDDNHTSADHCEHFFDEPTDHAPERYREGLSYQT